MGRWRNCEGHWCPSQDVEVLSECKRQALLVDQSIQASGQPNEGGCCVWTRHPIGCKSLSSGCQFSRVIYRSSTRLLGCRLADLGTPSQRSCSISRRSDLRRLRHLHKDSVINPVDDVQELSMIDNYNSCRDSWGYSVWPDWLFHNTNISFVIVSTALSNLCSVSGNRHTFSRSGLDHRQMGRLSSCLWAWGEEL